MDVETGGKEADAPRGVIGCLTAGFEVLGRNPWLVALPVMLDLVLWLGPRVSVAPLIEQLTQVLRMQPPADREVAGQVAQAIQLMERFGQRFNLLSLLSKLPVLHVPSLVARHAPGDVSPLGEARVFPLSSFLSLIPSWIGLILAGLVLGFLYLNELAHGVHTAGRPGERRDTVAPETNPTEASVNGARTSGLGKFARFVLFAFGLLGTGAALMPLWLLVTAVAAMIAQALGILVWVLGVGFVSYAALHLIFVLPGILLGGRRLPRAIGESVVLTHVKLSSVLGLVILAVIIYEGLGYAWSLPSGDSWALLVGILGNGCVATGLTAATFVFYQELMAGREQATASD